MNTPRDRQNVEAVLQVSVKANDELYREIRRDANMCDALRELMKDDLEDARKLGESEGEAKIIINMNHSGMSPENIASITGKDLDEINAILEGKVPALLKMSLKKENSKNLKLPLKYSRPRPIYIASKQDNNCFLQNRMEFEAERTAA